MKPWAKGALGGAGAALVVAGAVQTFRSAGDSGAVTMLVVGAVLLISPFVLDRLEHIAVTSTGFELRVSRSVAELGAPKAARLLDRSDLAGAVESYAFVRETLGDTSAEAKVTLQDALVQRAASLASREKFSASEVRLLLREGQPVARVLAVGLMKGDPSLADGPSVLDAISGSLSGNEQYHGMLLAQLCWRELTAAERGAVVAAIDSDPYIEGDRDRAKVADEIRALPRGDRPTG